MAVNDKIKYVDYNNIRDKVVGVLGPGSGDNGYGQAVNSAAVGVSNTVGINDWQNLYYDIYNAYYHQTGTAPSLGSIVENETVRYAADKPNFQYDTIANTIVTNKFNIATSQSATKAKGSNSQTWPGSLGSYWTGLVQCTITVTFSTAAKARHFFNSGGQIRFTTGRSGGTVSSQNTSWTNLLSSVSSINGGAGPIFGGNYPGTYIEPNDGQNYYRLSSTYASFYSLSASSPYGSNYFSIFAKSPNIGDNSGGTENQIQFLVYWSDSYVDPGIGIPPAGVQTQTPSAFPPGDLVDGTISMAVSTLYATGTLVPAGAGSFAVEDPVVSIGSIAEVYVAPPTPLAVEYLMVAGGGSGGSNAGGGGGAGGVINSTISILPGSYPITVGLGGASVTNSRGNSGQNTVAFGRTAIGGGGGGAAPGLTGLSGGSGGGGGYGTLGGATIYAQGNTGGQGASLTTLSGGGGGATQQGATGISGVNGIGGDGLLWLNGGYYAGGGGAVTRGGGAGGGGTGGDSFNSARSGTDGTGGGGGGAATGMASGKGGIGVVIARYAGAQVLSGGSVSSAGGYTYHTFYTAGSLVRS